jgi:hypothetical protein
LALNFPKRAPRFGVWRFHLKTGLRDIRMPARFLRRGL